MLLQWLVQSILRIQAMNDKLSLRNGALVRACAAFKEHFSLKGWVKLD